eukprot:COSAG06_NODE_382_length_16566_cov_8.629137_14_plen_185_part_00
MPACRCVLPVPWRRWLCVGPASQATCLVGQCSSSVAPTPLRIGVSRLRRPLASRRSGCRTLADNAPPACCRVHQSPVEYALSATPRVLINGPISMSVQRYVFGSVARTCVRVARCVVASGALGRQARRPASARRGPPPAATPSAATRRPSSRVCLFTQLCTWVTIEPASWALYSMKFFTRRQLQ